MGYTQAYQINLMSFENEAVQVTLYDKESYVDGNVDTNLVDLRTSQGTYPASPFTIKTVDDDKDLFKTIRAQQASIAFFSSNNFDFSTFSSGADDRWYVEARVLDTILFKGFLVMDDNSMPFLSHPNPVVLNATDNIGTLKEVPLTDFTSKNPKGKFKIIQFVAWCLSKTNLQLDIIVNSSYYEESFQGLCAWDNIYLDAKTFEKEIGTCEDCYTVLQKILGFDLCLSQYKGQWFITHIDEADQVPAEGFLFTWQGVYVQTVNTTLNQSIGSTQALKFLNNDQIISKARPKKYVKLAYDFTYPKEIIDNIDFTRGDILPLVPSMEPLVRSYNTKTSFPATGNSALIYLATDTGKFFEWIGGTYRELTGDDRPTAEADLLADWTYVRLPNLSVQATGYIRRIYRNSEERERCIVAPKTAGGGHAFRSGRLRMEYKDKFNLSLDWRLNSDVSGSGSATESVMEVRLYGDNGTYWMLTNQASGSEVPGDWVESNSAFSSNNRFIKIIYDIGSTDESDWQTATVSTKPIPVGGDIEIYILQNSQNTTTRDTHFANLNFTYLPYINGTYQKYSGKYRKVSQTGNFKDNIDDTVFISDSSRQLFKGAMFKQIDSVFVLAGNWYAGRDLANQGITPPIPAQYLHPFGHLQIYAVWNKNRREMQRVEGSVLGLNLAAGNIPEPASLFTLNDANIYSNNRKFLASALDIDFHTCRFTVTLLELSDVTKPNIYTDPEEVKYIIA